jgi:hypothetical protein
MAKGKSQRALFEILTKEKAQDRRPAETKPGPIVRRFGGEEPEQPPAPMPVRPALPAPGQMPAPPVRISLTVYWIVVAAAAVACLCALFYLWGMRSRVEPVPPNVPKRPTMEEVSQAPVAEDLVGKRAETSGAGEGAGKGAGEGTIQGAGEGTGVGETGGSAAEGKFRLRIARLEVSRSEYTDQLRTLLAGRGIETDLAARGGYFILYSRDRVAKMDDEKAKALQQKVVEGLKEFEQKTGWPATTNPYFVTVP